MRRETHQAPPETRLVHLEQPLVPFAHGPGLVQLLADLPRLRSLLVHALSFAPSDPLDLNQEPPRALSYFLPEHELPALLRPDPSGPMLAESSFRAN